MMRIDEREKKQETEHTVRLSAALSSSFNFHCKGYYHYIQLWCFQLNGCEEAGQFGSLELPRFAERQAIRTLWAGRSPAGCVHWYITTGAAAAFGRRGDAVGRVDALPVLK